MRYGWVAGKDVSLCGGVEVLFRVVFPRNAPSEAESEVSLSRTPCSLYRIERV